MGVFETWFGVDIQNVQNFKDLSDKAWDIQILITGFHLQIKRNKDLVKKPNTLFSKKILPKCSNFVAKQVFED